ncbi:unnamed protein product, partial [Effrenium voratum]
QLQRAAAERKRSLQKAKVQLQEKHNKCREYSKKVAQLQSEKAVAVRVCEENKRFFELRLSEHAGLAGGARLDPTPTWRDTSPELRELAERLAEHARQLKAAQRSHGAQRLKGPDKNSIPSAAGIAGDFSCVQCGRQRLPASEFSRKQVERALESLKNIKDQDIRTGPEIQSVVHLSGVCKKCTEEREQREREEAAARKAAAGEAKAEEEPLAAPEVVEVGFTSRPFGMTAAKGPGYVVLKVSENKPAVQ